VLSRPAFLVLVALATLGCHKKRKPPPPGPTPLADASVAAPAGTLEPLLVLRDKDRLAVPQYGDAAICVPTGATRPRPVVLGVHGNAETPEQVCAALHDIVRARAFVLCPRGVKPPNERDYPGYLFTSPQTLALEVEAGLKALDKTYPGYVDADDVLYVGFSRGAYLSVAILSTEPAKYPRAVLIEGGQDAWTQDLINAFGAAGGKRVLFACGQEDCDSEAHAIADRLGEVGVEAAVVFRNAGHVYTGPIQDDIRGGLEWVIRDDPRWD
jgi:predicted esterase